MTPLIWKNLSWKYLSSATYACLLLTVMSTVLLSSAFAADEKEKKPKKDPDAGYVPGPDSMTHEGVPQGQLIKNHMKDCKTYPGIERDWWIYVPAQYDATKPACLLVFQDGGGYIDRNGGMRMLNVMDNLIHKKQMPVTIGVFINPGDKQYKPGEAPRKKADGSPAGATNRSIEYDTMSDVYSQFLLTELLPQVTSEYNITKDPAGRAIGGSSSGAICAFTVAWNHPDQFRNVVSFIGSYTNIRGGDKYPEIVKTSERKDLRIYQQDGKNDVVNQFGSWWEANNKMADILQEKGYDHIFVTGEGAHNGKHAAMLMPDAIRWIFRDAPR
jgi:enterochelin esterase family protein